MTNLEKLETVRAKMADLGDGPYMHMDLLDEVIADMKMVESKLYPRDWKRDRPAGGPADRPAEPQR